jgi:hypothetical protein
MLDTFNSAEDMRDRGFHMMDPPLAILNYDPAGDGDDRDAIIMLQREEWRRGELHDPDLAVEYIFRILLAQRLPKDDEFPDKLARILGANRQLRQWKNQGRIWEYVIGVEQNGLGYAMASSLRTKTNTPVIGYTTVRNTSDKPYTAKNVSMPRLAALDNLRVMLEIHRLKIAKDCVGKKELIGEMNSFVWAAPGRPEAVDGQHDDLVMALCGAIWIGTKLIPPYNKQLKIDPKRGIKDHRQRTKGNIRIN